MDDTEIPQGRTRTYATIIYTESAPKDWQEILQEEHIPCHISPLHDKDINKDGTLKKPHYHVVLKFDGIKTRKQAEKVFKKIGGVGAEVVNSPRAYMRYLCHLDNPDKVQYPVEEVVSYGGADYDMYINTAKDIYTTIGDIIDFCIANNIVCFADLLVHTKETQFNWFKIICDHSMLLCQFLKSKYWDENRQGVKHAAKVTKHENQAEEPTQEDIAK